MVGVRQSYLLQRTRLLGSLSTILAGLHFTIIILFTTALATYLTAHYLIVNCILCHNVPFLVLTSETKWHFHFKKLTKTDLTIYYARIMLDALAHLLCSYYAGIIGPGLKALLSNS